MSENAFKERTAQANEKKTVTDLQAAFSEAQQQHTEACDQASAAQRALAEAVEAQSAERAAIEEAQRRLDEAQRRLDDAVALLAARLREARRAVRGAVVRVHMLRTRRLGPWCIEMGIHQRWPGGQLHQAERKADYWSRRAWLRVVFREGRTPTWQWEAEIHDCPTLLLGPPTADPVADFAKHQRTVEDTLIERGHYITFEAS